MNKNQHVRFSIQTKLFPNSNCPQNFEIIYISVQKQEILAIAVLPLVASTLIVFIKMGELFVIVALDSQEIPSLNVDGLSLTEMTRAIHHHGKDRKNFGTSPSFRTLCKKL